MTKFTKYLAVNTPVMNEMFAEYLHAFEVQFGEQPTEIREAMEAAYKTGVGRGVTNNLGEADHATILKETLDFSVHQVQTSRSESADEDAVVGSLH